MRFFIARSIARLVVAAAAGVAFAVAGAGFAQADDSVPATGGPAVVEPAPSTTPTNGTNNWPWG